MRKYFMIGTVMAAMVLTVGCGNGKKEEATTAVATTVAETTVQETTVEETTTVAETTAVEEATTKAKKKTKKKADKGEAAIMKKNKEETTEKVTETATEKVTKKVETTTKKAKKVVKKKNWVQQPYIPAWAHSTFRINLLLPKTILVSLFLFRDCSKGQSRLRFSFLKTLQHFFSHLYLR